MGWVITAAFWIFIFWRIRRAKENAAEMAASGELRSPLYWTGAILAIGVLALSMVMAAMKPGTIGSAWWLLAVALFVATLLIRRALLWRYPHGRP
jgi:hypothetical protein